MVTPEKIANEQERPSVLISLRPGCTFSGLLECIEVVLPERASSLHVYDPNWFEDGDYISCRLERVLHEDLEQHLKDQDLLSEEEKLTGHCYYSPEKYIPSHGDFILGAKGTDHDDDGPLIACWIDEKAEPFEFK